MTQGIDHDIAHKEDRFLRPPFPEQVLRGILLRNEKVFGQSVCQYAVDLFGHAAVKAAQPSLYVGYGNPELRGGQRNGDGGVDVANDQNNVGLLFQQNGFDAF